jgi:hypothetical protein
VEEVRYSLINLSDLEYNCIIAAIKPTIPEWEKSLHFKFLVQPLKDVLHRHHLDYDREPDKEV